MQELINLIRENIDYHLTNVHTSFPGVVVKYDAATRRADIQPSLKRRLPDGKFADFPILPDIPIHFPGTKKYTIHIMLEKGDEVAVFVTERSTDVWRDKGMNGIEDNDPRRFNLQDCFAMPGCQPVEFIPVTDAGLNIIHKTNFNGDFISSLTMDDDKIELKYKEKSDVLMRDDYIKAKTEKCSAEMTKDVITSTNSQITAKLNAKKASLKNGEVDYYTVINQFMEDVINMETVGSPALHIIRPDHKIKLKKDQSDFGKIMEAG